jgi:hypothetical protein
MGVSSEMTSASAVAAPPVTIVLTCRERHGLTEATIETVLRNTRMPFRLIYADVCAPEHVRTKLAMRAGEWPIEILRFDEPLWPAEVRRRLAPMIDSEYAVFIDNDVLVAPGWLERLYACAEETGAGIVGPLYLWGANARSERIHMAAGILTETKENGGIVLVEQHRYGDHRVGQVPLQREPCDFVEYHCMLMRKALFREPAVFDEEILCVHEHIHASLIARRLGYKTWFEPEAQVCYLALAPYRFSDLPLFRWRWSHEAGEQSLAAFAARWGVIDDDRSFGDVRNFLCDHRADVDPVRSTLQDPRFANAPMQESDLKQNLTGLLELARARGYSGTDLEKIKWAHWTALLLANGGYRPCTRPFIAHLIGSASVLTHYGFETRLIQTALLHAAYSHAPPAGTPQAAIEAVTRALGALGQTVERMVRAYTVRGERWRRLAEMANWQDVAVMAEIDIAVLGMANHVEMHLSGEMRETGRDTEEPAAISKAAEVCAILGVPRLAMTIAALEQGPRAAAANHPRLQQSFRIVDGKLVPMVNRAFFQVLESAQEASGPRVAINEW